MTRTDVAVIGAGICELATALALAERGATVTVYERGVPGAAQSGGESRIFRHAHDDRRLVAFAREARALWRAWEERFGVELVAAVGSVALGPAVERRLSLLRDAGVRARLVDAADGRRTTAYVAEALPGLEPEPVETRTCSVTELPWGHDGLAVWEAGALLFVAGNNLFKHAPALGSALAGAALGEGLRDELRPEARLGANVNCAG